MLPRRLLGQTGFEVSAISLGTVKLGRNQGVKYPKAFDLPDDADMATLLEGAKSLGINVLDTAPAYGHSEKRLGSWLKNNANRSEWIIVSKFGEEFVEGQSLFDFSKKAAFRSIDESLRRLQTDYLDLMLVHSNGHDVELIEKYGVFETLKELKQLGKIRSFGMSTKTIEGGVRAVDQSDVVMVTYNPWATEELPVIQHAHALGKGVLIKKALASGHACQMSEEVNPVKQAIQFVLAEPGVSSVVVGTLNVEHLKEVVEYARLLR